MKKLRKTIDTGLIEGSYHPDFEPVVLEFERNFTERGEVGASLAIMLEGKTCLDIWGGMADPDCERSWERETVCTVFSSTKGATALCAHLLVDRGEIELHEMVSSFWPEFEAGGKGAATVAMMLDHSVGVPAIREPLYPGCWEDPEYMQGLVAKEASFWQPGTAHGYHAFTYSWTVGELVRRISGKTLGAFFQDEVAKPLGLDYWIGLPEECENRVAPILLPDPTNIPSTAFSRAIEKNPECDSALMMNMGEFFPQRCNTRPARAAEIGAASGVTNARGLAGMYSPLACAGKENTLISETSMLKMSQVSQAGFDQMLLIPTRFSLGFMKTVDNRHLVNGDIQSLLLGDQAFGHAGVGGSLGFADPAIQMSLGYTMNKLGHGVFVNERGQSLVNAAYKCLGYQSNKSGYWAK